MTGPFRIRASLVGGAVTGLHIAIPSEILELMGVQDRESWAKEHMVVWERQDNGSCTIKFLKLS